MTNILYFRNSLWSCVAECGSLHEVNISYYIHLLYTNACNEKCLWYFVWEGFYTTSLWNSAFHGAGKWFSEYWVELKSLGIFVSVSTLANSCNPGQEYALIIYQTEIQKWFLLSSCCWLNTAFYFPDHTQPLCRLVLLGWEHKLPSKSHEHDMITSVIMNWISWWKVSYLVIYRTLIITSLSQFTVLQ